MRKQAILFAVLLILVINITSAATYYVNKQNTKCSDTYSTTQAKNISTPWCDLQQGLDNLASGDTLYILSGEYNGNYVLENNDFTANVTIRAYPDNDVYITNYNKGYANGSNSLWTSLGSGVWKTKLSSSEVDNPRIYYKSGTKFFTWSDKSNFLSSSYPENTWYDSSTKEAYVKFSDTGKNPNSISLYISDYLQPLIIRKNSITSSSYIIVRGLNFKYSSNDISIDDQSNVVVRECSFDGAHLGIEVLNHDIPGRTNIIIRDNYFNGRANMNWYGEDMKNELEETSGIFVFNHKGKVEIYNNKFTYWHGGILLATNEPDECDNSVVHDNTFSKGKGSQLEIENYCSNSEWYNNKIYDSEMGVSFAPADASQSQNPCKFHHNQIILNGELLWNETTSFKSYAIKADWRDLGVKNWNINHNTFAGYGRALYGIEDNAFAADMTFKDNIFYADEEQILFKTGSPSNNIFYDYNLYYSPSGGYPIFMKWSTSGDMNQFESLSDAKASSYWDGTWDIHSKEADPLFTNLAGNDVTPKSGSPACTMSSTGSYVGALPCVSSPPQNIAPTHSTPLLRASDYPNNTTDANLTCYNQSTTDANGDKVINIYQWYRNSSLMSAFANRTVITASNTEVGQRWVCQITPFDGKAYGTSRNSSSLLILASPFCGDKICNGKENCTTCSGDCGVCPVLPVCGDKVCNGKENCTTCSGDCGTCPAPNNNITACTLPDLSWNEDELLKNAYNLSACFKDPLKSTLSFRASGNKNITVSIVKGIVDLYAPADWNGFELVRFIASSGNRSAYTNRATLTVLPVPDCGDGVCDSSESCSSCSSDCGECPAPPDSGGGGGGGGGGSLPTIFDWVCEEWSECVNGEQIQLCNDAGRDVQKTNTKTCEPVIEPVAEPADEPVIEPVANPVVEPDVDTHSFGGNDFAVLPGEEEKTGSANVLTGSGSDEEIAEAEASKTKKSSDQLTGMVTNDHSTKPRNLLITGFFVVMVVVALMFIQFKKKQDSVEKSQTLTDDTWELNDYIVEAAKRGFSKDHVKAALINVGWPIDIIEAAMACSSAEFLPKIEESAFTNQNQERAFNN